MTSTHIDDLARFVTASPSSYHAAEEVARRLVEAGYLRLEESHDWPSEPGGYVVVRDGAVIAWVIGEDAPAGGFRIVGAHTDSPSLKLKPEPTSTRSGWQQAGMEVYGGPLPNSWLDREFALAGRIVDAHGGVHLVHTPAWLRIPQVAPHLDRSVNEKLSLDRQAHLWPVFAVGDYGADILALVAGTVGLGKQDVAGHDLYAAVTEKPAVFGPAGEFFASSRLDNLSSVHAGLVALLDADEGPDVMVLACFDHEEIGSDTRSGAGGPFLESVLRRIGAGFGDDEAGFQRRLARSSLVSSDAGHAVHPNYAHLHDPDHRPLLNAGTLLKINANGRDTSDAASIALWRRACAAAGVPVQPFVSNNAVPCGSTIGPITATRLGLLSVDVGIPLLSMHSTRELAGVKDPGWLADALRAYFEGV